MIVEIPVFHNPDGSRTVGQPDPRHGVRLGPIATAVLNVAGNPCDCLSCQVGRPDYPCLIEEEQ